MNANLLSILTQIIAEQGESVLAEPQRLKALFSDYAKNEQKEERVAFGRCIEMGAYQELKKTRTADERRRVKTALIDQVNAKTGIDTQHCEEALDLLEAVMFKPEPHGTPAPSQTRVCSSCGKELQKEWATCPYCSTPVAKREMQASRRKQPQTGEMPKNIKRLLLIAAIVAPVILVVAIILGLFFDADVYDSVVGILGYLTVPISTVLIVLGQRKNNRKMILAASIVYFICFILGIPSAVLCFIAFAKMKKNDKAKY